MSLTRFTPLTRSRLCIAGWHEGRHIATHPFASFYRLFGYEMTPVLETALAEFGNLLLCRPILKPMLFQSRLRIFHRPLERPERIERLISPYLACGYTVHTTIEALNDLFMPSAGSQLIPFAAAPGWDDLWLMDAMGRVFLTTDLSWLGLIGENIDVAIDSLLSGRKTEMQIFNTLDIEE